LSSSGGAGDRHSSRELSGGPPISAVNRTSIEAARPLGHHHKVNLS